MKTLVDILIVMILAHFLSRQKEFTIFSYQGKVEIIKGKKSVPLHVQRDSLFSGDKIMLHSGATVILYRDNGSTIILSTPATYSVDSMAALAKGGEEKDLLSDYITFLQSEFKKDNETLDEYSSRNMKEKGGVNRGRMCDSRLLFPPESANSINEPNTFIWTTKSDSAIFEIYSTEEFGKALFTAVTNDTILRLKMPVPLKAHKSYYWSVRHNKETNCQRSKFKILDTDEISAVSNDIKLINTYRRLNEETRQLLKAACYEKHGLYMEAFISYEKALDKAQNKDNIKIYFTVFLARIGMQEETLRNMK